MQLFPRWKSQRHQFGSGGYFIFKDSQFKDEGWEFNKFSVTPEAVAVDKRVIENTTTPARRSLMTAERYAGTGPTSLGGLLRYRGRTSGYGPDSGAAGLRTP